MKMSIYVSIIHAELVTTEISLNAYFRVFGDLFYVNRDSLLPKDPYVPTSGSSI